MIYYTIYKTTNKVNNKIYVGKHQTKDLEDDYLGSGKYLRNAINKYGIDKFVKEILHICGSLEEMNKKESEIVNEEFIVRKDTYNLRIGGEGGFDYISSNNLNPYLGGNIVAIKRQNDIEYDRKYRTKISTTMLLHFEKGGINGFQYKKHSEETKKKMGGKSHQKGSGNSQFGSCWIHNEELKESKKVKKEELQIWLDEGWIKGRKIKF